MCSMYTILLQLLPKVLSKTIKINFPINFTISTINIISFYSFSNSTQIQIW